ncbi:hypothetical protein M885DRAFT_506299 [Pelagophyceae sp. CCMP2097]|nr:hypothetical protein M885DRAFT_506299 [Pelagophyceae sp. CCMP2097]
MGTVTNLEQDLDSMEEALGRGCTLFASPADGRLGAPGASALSPRSPRASPLTLGPAGASSLSPRSPRSSPLTPRRSALQASQSFARAVAAEAALEAANAKHAAEVDVLRAQARSFFDDVVRRVQGAVTQNAALERQHDATLRKLDAHHASTRADRARAKTHAAERAADAAKATDVDRAHTAERAAAAAVERQLRDELQAAHCSAAALAARCEAAVAEARAERDEFRAADDGARKAALAGEARELSLLEAGDSSAAEARAHEAAAERHASEAESHRRRASALEAQLASVEAQLLQSQQQHADDLLLPPKEQGQWQQGSPVPWEERSARHRLDDISRGETRGSDIFDVDVDGDGDTFLRTGDAGSGGDGFDSEDDAAPAGRGSRRSFPRHPGPTPARQPPATPPRHWQSQQSTPSRLTPPRLTPPRLTPLRESFASGSRLGGRSLLSLPSVSDDAPQTAEQQRDEAARLQLGALELRAVTELHALLREGLVLLKHGRTGAPKKRRFFAGDGRELFWESRHAQSGTFLLEPDVAVTRGKATRLFERATATPADCCFSLVRRRRPGSRDTLDLEASSKEERDAIADGFALLIRYLANPAAAPLSSLSPPQP